MDDDLMIVECEEGDLEEILDIERDSYPTPWSPHIFRSEMINPLSRMLVGKVAGDLGRGVAGYIVFWQVSDEIHLHNIAVQRNLRRKGIASRLLTRTVQIAHSEEIRWMHLEVRSSNHAARKLYENFGFVVQGVRRNYYTETGEDAVIMSADLKRAVARERTPMENGK